VVVVLREAGRRARRLLRYDMLVWFPAIEASRWSSAWFKSVRLDRLHKKVRMRARRTL
jgi:hypothetical protein